MRDKRALVQKRQDVEKARLDARVTTLRQLVEHSVGGKDAGAGAAGNLRSKKVGRV